MLYGVNVNVMMCVYVCSCCQTGVRYTAEGSCLIYMELDDWRVRVVEIQSQRLNALFCIYYSLATPTKSMIF